MSNPGHTSFLFIINKFSGTGYRSEIEDRISRACSTHKVNCTIEFTRGRGHATELAREAASRGFHNVVAVGGDGTINEVAIGLLGTKIPMGILPKGSGNGLARHLGIPLRFPAALNSLFTSDTVAMDIFRLNGKVSLNVSGIGFDGHIASLFGEKSKRGLAGYTTLAMQEFMRFNEFEATFTTGGKTFHRKAFVIAIANASQYGNNARIVPVASVCDQILHVNILQKVPAYRVDFMLSFFYGQIDKSAFCEIFQTDSIQIATKHPVPYHVDGEPCGAASEFNIELTPAALHVLAPAKGSRRGYL